MASSNPTSDRCLAVITGATGITGRHCLERVLTSQKGWHVLTLSRRTLELDTLSGQDQRDRVHQAHANLLEQNEVKTALQEACPAELFGQQQGTDDGGDGSEVQAVRIYHCAYLESGEGPVRDCQLNVAMLKNVVEAVESLGWPLKHVFTMEGTKWYGQQFLKPLKTPFDENDDRHVGPNFYFDLQDYLASRVAGFDINIVPNTGPGSVGAPKNAASWTWSALRPNPVMGFSTGSYMSLLPSIAVYGAICKELGHKQMRFPGTITAYNELMEVCDARVLAEGMLFTSTEEKAANEAYNINNGDLFRWCHVWPKICQWFGLEAGAPLSVGGAGGDLTVIMSEYKGVWEDMVKKYGLKDIPYEKLATWKFLGFVFQMPEGGWFSNTLKLRKAGFLGMTVSTEESILNQLQELRDNKIIP